MKKLILIVIFGIFPFYSFSQVCGTPPMDSVEFVNQPWFGNNQYLLDLLEDVDAEYGIAPPPQNSQYQDIPILGGMDRQVYFWIPVKAWVYREDNGSGGINQTEVEESIKILNEYFRGSENPSSQIHPHSHIQFYLLCDIEYKNSSEQLNINNVY